MGLEKIVQMNNKINIVISVYENAAKIYPFGVNVCRCAKTVGIIINNEIRTHTEMKTLTQESHAILHRQECHRGKVSFWSS